MEPGVTCRALAGCAVAVTLALCLGSGCASSSSRPVDGAMPDGSSPDGGQGPGPDDGSIADGGPRDASMSTGDGSTDAAVVCTGTPRLELGTGPDSFEIIPDDAELPLVHGPQGGWHIWASLDVHNIGHTARIAISYALVESGVVVSAFDGQRVRMLTDPDDPCHHSYVGITAYAARPADIGLAVDPCDNPPEVYGHREVCMHMEVTDEDDVTVSDDKCFVAVPWELDSAEIDPTCFPP